MKKTIETNKKRARRKARTRAKISGTARQPRISVFRSNKYFYAQLIDDEKGHTLAHVSTKSLGSKKATKTSQSMELGKVLAEAAQKLGVKKAVFDRGSYKYHGRVAQFAESLRKSGLKI